MAWQGRAGGWVALAGTKKAVSPYPAQATPGAFFRKEVAPEAPPGLSSKAMVEPCLHSGRTA